MSGADWLALLLIMAPGVVLLLGLALDTTPPKKLRGWIHGSHTD